MENFRVELLVPRMADVWQAGVVDSSPWRKMPAPGTPEEEPGMSKALFSNMATSYFTLSAEMSLSPSGRL